MLDKTFVTKKMSLLREHVADMEDLAMKAPVGEIRRDKIKLSAVERFFQLAVDQMVDINTHLIKSGDFGTVDDLQSTFTMLGDFGVLAVDFAKKVAPIVGVRNMLVHRYEKLDKGMFLKNLVNNFSDFKTYLIQIDEYLKKAE